MVSNLWVTDLVSIFENKCNKGPTWARIALLAGFWNKIKAKQNKRHKDIKSQMIYADTMTHILGSDI